MKKKILLALLVFAAGHVFAQDSLRTRHSIGLGYAASVPVGNFSNNDFEKEYPPLAKEGGLLQVNYVYALKYKIWLGGTLAWRHNKYDINTFAKADDALVESRKSSSWQSYITTADAYYLLHARDGFVYVKGSLGTAYHRTYSLRVQTPYGTIAHEAVTAIAFAYGASIGAQVRLQRFGLGLDSGILCSAPTFKRTTTQGNSITFRQPMNSIQFGIFTTYTF